MANTVKLAADLQDLVDRSLARVQRASEIPPRLLDVDDAGRYLSMSDKSVRELIIEGQLAFVQKIPGRSPYLIDIRDLDKWVEKNKRLAGK
jgi:excisionase family DNA binding protein